MLNLVPDWAQQYGEFWRAIRLRNMWLIKLRYMAVIILFGFLLTGEYLFDFQLTQRQVTAISVLCFIILAYNIVIQSLRGYVSVNAEAFNALHLSLLQIILDLTALMFLVYFTGTLESPLYMFFIFHMIIGSLILPGYIVYFTAGIISGMMALLTFLQRYRIIESHIIKGLYVGNRPNTFMYDLLFIIIFSIMLFISVYIANKIAHQLYKREQQLRNSLAKLNEAEITKQKYTIGIVHEIKTPITAVQSIIELIKNGYVGSISDEVAQKLNRAQIRSEEALQLIKNVLNISKLRLLDISLSDDIIISETVNSIVEAHSEIINLKSITVSLMDKRKNDRRLRSDKILFSLVVSNILSNALKYVGEKGKVEINVYGDDEKIFLEISDNGIGIPGQEKEKIFDQFYRASNIDKSLHEGTGMGLAVVKEIIVKLGGVIDVISPSHLGTENNPGTTFRIMIPYKVKQNEYDIFVVNDEDYLKNKDSL